MNNLYILTRPTRKNKMNWKVFIKYRGSHNHILKKKKLVEKLVGTSHNLGQKGKKILPHFQNHIAFNI